MIDPIIWAVVFKRSQSEEKHFTARFLHKDFSHCYLIRECGSGSLIIDPLKWGLATVYEPHDFNDVVEHHGKDATAVLMCMADYKLCTYPIFRGIYSCVMIVKAALGIKRSKFVVTPKQLYRLLLRKKWVKVIKPWSPWME